MKHAFMTTALLIVFLLAACSTGGGTSIANLDGEWTLVSMLGEAPIAGSIITAVFENGEIGGRAGCNSYGGQYTTRDGQITFSDIYQTEMACMDPEGIMDQESTYTQTLSQVVGFSITDDNLQLQNAAGETVLEFSKP